MNYKRMKIVSIKEDKGRDIWFVVVQNKSENSHIGLTFEFANNHALLNDDYSLSEEKLLDFLKDKKLDAVNTLTIYGVANDEILREILEERFYKAEDIAEMLDVNIMTIYRYIKAGKLKAYKIGKEFRIEKAEYQSFLEKSKYEKN